MTSIHLIGPFIDDLIQVKHWFKNRRAKFRRTDGWEARSQMNDEETAPEYVLSVLRNHYPEERISSIKNRAPLTGHFVRKVLDQK